MIDSYFPLVEREKLVSDLEKVIEELVDSVTGKNLLFNNALKAFASSLNWQVYLTDPATTALLIGERLPEDIKRAVDLSSYENRILNGHITARFFFNVLTSYSCTTSADSSLRLPNHCCRPWSFRP